jgi:ferredoxin-type protein NapH
MRKPTEPRPIVRYRYAILALTVLLFLPPLAAVVQLTGNERFCGTWCPQMFFVWRHGQTWSAYLAGFMRAYMGVALVTGVLATTFFLGRHWCGYLCPVGGLMELGSKLVPRPLKIDYSALPAPAFRYGVLAVYFLAPAIGIGSLGCSYCNFGTAPRVVGAAFSLADAAFFLRTTGLISLGLMVGLGFLSRGGRTYCNLLCPVGALDAISNALGAKFRRRRMFVTPAKCNGCGTCARVCPLAAINAKDGTAKIDQLSCMPCRMCETACPKGAIDYGKVPQ